mgnify:CR=1 FL=1
MGGARGGERVVVSAFGRRSHRGELRVEAGRVRLDLVQPIARRFDLCVVVGEALPLHRELRAIDGPATKLLAEVAIVGAELLEHGLDTAPCDAAREQREQRGEQKAEEREEHGADGQWIHLEAMSQCASASAASARPARAATSRHVSA